MARKREGKNEKQSLGRTKKGTGKKAKRKPGHKQRKAVMVAKANKKGTATRQFLIGNELGYEPYSLGEDYEESPPMIFATAEDAYLAWRRLQAAVEARWERRKEAFRRLGRG